MFKGAIHMYKLGYRAIDVQFNYKYIYLHITKCLEPIARTRIISVQSANLTSR